MAIQEGLPNFVSSLVDLFKQLPERPLHGNVAFVGTPGVGKTTALCKKISDEVFIQGKEVHVLKLEAEAPNSDDALRVFCDILGVSIWRDYADLETFQET